MALLAPNLKIAITLLALAFGACRRGVDIRSPGASVILISIDTLRSDRVGAYGSKAGLTPHLDALATQSVVFEEAYSHVPLTLPAHASLFTSLLPARHGVRDNLGYTLSGKRTLAEGFKAKGYRTLAAISSFVLRKGTGIAAGFDEYDDDIATRTDAALGHQQRDGVRTAQGLADRIAAVKGPVFAFLHIYEPHTPYEPIEPYASQYPNQPYVGRNAFAHKGGMHVAGVRAEAASFEHVAPESVGNRRELVMSELAGKGTALEKAQAAGLQIDDATAARIVDRVKQLEHLGYQFEAADGSLELLMRRETGDYVPLFQLESWRTIVEQQADGKVVCEATLKIWIDGERYVRTAEGNGPVNALDAALRDAIGEIHPHLRDIKLVNYKVRILDETLGTGATTRVLIDASDGQEVWGTIGVAENVIAASWQALVDSLEFGEQPPGRRAGDPAGAETTERT